MTHDPAKNARLAAYLATPEGKAAFAALAAHGDVVARAAQALRDGENEAALPKPPAPDRPPPPQTSLPDAAMLSALMGTLGELNRVDKRLEALLCALKAYLPPDGCRRLDRAAELARLMRLMERLNGGELSAPDPKRSD